MENTNMQFTTKELNTRIKRRMNGRDVSGAGVLLDVADCLTHEIECGDWTPICLQVSRAGQTESSRLKRIYGVFGIKFVSCKKSSTGLRCNMPRVSDRVTKEGGAWYEAKLVLLRRYIEAGLSFDSRVLATGRDAADAADKLPAFFPAKEKAGWTMATFDKAVIMALEAGADAAALKLRVEALAIDFAQQKAA